MDKYLGKRLDGRYEMRELIGVGGMAYVYKAYDAVDDRIVAVKILKDEFLNSDEFVRRFRNESKAIAILNHPNIVKVLDVGFGERLQYIVMEYIDGITLKEYLDQRKDIRWKEAVHFTVQILRALQHAHDKGIVHRDIKPQNIMLLSDGTIKVTDFGIARLTRNEMKATVEGNKAIGSVHYISPEQARGEITDEKTDLYAVGIMLYEMLTGRLPFEADNAVSVAIMQMQSEAKAPRQINEEIPEGLEQITLKAMQKDTAKRYQSAAEMLNDFDEFKRNPSIKFEYTYMVDETPTRYVDAITRVRGEAPESEPIPPKEEPVKKKVAKKKNKNKNMAKMVTLIVILCLVAILLVWAIIVAIGTVNGTIDVFPKLFPKLFGSSDFDKKADEITVEKFIGMNYYAEIEGATEYQGKYKFKVEFEDSKKPDVKKGEVFKQEPGAGKTVKKGGTITLYVHTPVMKDIRLDADAEIEGVAKEEVLRLLENAGFEVNEVPSSSEVIPEGCVISIDIRKGETYVYGHEVTVLVSTGPSVLEPIPFPQDIIGESQETVEAILKDAGFEGKPITVDSNYSDEKHKAVGTVIGVMIDNVLQEELPKEIKPDGSLTLVLSNGLKDVTVELEWPKSESGKNVNMQLSVRVNVDGNTNPELSSKYTETNPYYLTTDKMTFAFTSHPRKSEPYYVGIEIKKASDTSDAYKMYAKLLIKPAEGAWEIEGGYQYIDGINPEMIAIPNGILDQTMSVSELKAQLNSFDIEFVVTNNVTLTDTMWVRVDRIVYNGAPMFAGNLVKKGAKITVRVTAMTGSTSMDVPTNVFDADPMSWDSILRQLFGSFPNAAVVDENGNTLSSGNNLKIVKLVYVDENNTTHTITANAMLPAQLPKDTGIQIYVKSAGDVATMLPVYNGEGQLWGQVKQKYVNDFNCVYKSEAGFDIAENDAWEVVDIRNENGNSLLDPINQTLAKGSTLIVVLKRAD